MNSLRRAGFSCLFVFFVTALVWAGDVSLSFQYSTIKNYGTIEEMQRRASGEDRLIKSEDGKHAYLVRSVSVRDEAHLLQLMGAVNENDLSDLQKGLLASYRFSANQQLVELKQRFPGKEGNIFVDLIDINGYTDTAKYPDIVEDFWPNNSRLVSYGEDGASVESRIRITGSDLIGHGPSTAQAMQKTFAHEFGHSLDLTEVAANSYGHDGSHYINEKIDEPASFAEGFANFIMMLFFPEEEETYRYNLRTIKIEKPEGGYDEYKISEKMLKGEEYLNVEAVNALIFTKMAAELPNGRNLVLDSFERHNNRSNRMASFLKNFIGDHPQHAEKVAAILDRETFGHLTAEQMTGILGNSSGVQSYLQKRSESGSAQVSSVEPAQPPVAREVPETSGKTRVYKWYDEDGNVHFSGQPPTDGREYTIITSQPQKPVKIENVGSDNPFDLR
ncbi:MAG: DUF4124 domain-containing protein [Candidatus Rifleibacteriota bacterium]